MEVTGQIWNFLRERSTLGESPIGLYGARRSSKTWTISQFLLSQAFDYGDKIIFASMTENQGDAGAYEDCKNIIANNDAWSPYFVITRSPRRINCRFMRGAKYGQVIFRSFKDADTAKGAACDWVYINEANKFTLKQYYAITANARKGVVVDYNPEDGKFWAEDIIKPENLLQCKWQWNKRHLTAIQLKWFEDLKSAAESPNATSADIAFYRRYYLGEYSEIMGPIFTPANLVQADTLPQGLYSPIAFADPSAMRGADYFAMVLGLTDGERVYIAETFSENTGGYELPTTVLQEWQQKYPGLEIYAETNGLAGVEFYEFARNSGLLVRAWCSRGNKFERIVGEYQMILTRLVWVNTPPTFLSQVYSFDKTCEHDDNIDAANSLLMAYKLRRLI